MRSRRLTSLLLISLLAALLFGWAHAAEHAGEARSDDTCATCQWVKHSPAGAVPAPQASLALVFLALVVVRTPVARGLVAVARPGSRAPPRAA